MDRQIAEQRLVAGEEFPQGIEQQRFAEAARA
jgi:hypothetical protein